jgi:hypothetical protein
MLQVIEKYCDVYIGNTSLLPIVRLKPCGVTNSCPLLKDGKCGVHDMKPVVCALYPLGRTVISVNPGEVFQSDGPTKIGYVLMPVQCGSQKRKQTVRSWLERFNIPAEDAFFFKWNETVTSLANSMIRLNEKGASKKSFEIMMNGIYSALYTSCDTDKDFMPQFLENSEKILKIISTAETQFVFNLYN